VHIEDQTKKLIEEGYWGSYNIPVYDDIAEQSGYKKLCSIDAKNCHDTAPRAKLFKKYQEQIKDVEGGKWILYYNNFQNDSESINDSCNAIACRGDLEPRVLSRGGYGALDAKVTTAVKSKRVVGDVPELHARLGPSSDQQKVFCWNDLSDEQQYVHNGQPDCFDFKWQVLPPLRV
jgi:hypothetical protein